MEYAYYAVRAKSLNITEGNLAFKVKECGILRAKEHLARFQQY